MDAPDPLSLSGKTAIVTGASRGLGLQIARALAAEGASVVLLARASEALAAAARELPQALATPCDLRSPDDIRGAFTAAAQHFGRIDILVNNAAVCVLQTIEDAEDEDLRRELETNLLAPVFCAREAIPHMRAAGGGDIVNISSESVRMAFPFLTLYAATKGGLEHFSGALRGELRPYGIRVMVLRSGSVRGGAIGADWPPDRRDAFVQAAAASGALAFAGEAIHPQTTARALVNLLRTPREASIDLVEVLAV
jgi:NAD(P)-dependent dehydrogenase (short-subunit alcohol dehydrogenase family)